MRKSVPQIISPKSGFTWPTSTKSLFGMQSVGAETLLQLGLNSCDGFDAFSEHVYLSVELETLTVRLYPLRCVYLQREGGCPGDKEHGGRRVRVWREEDQCGGEIVPQSSQCRTSVSH